jgi:hypothetical protein
MSPKNIIASDVYPEQVLWREGPIAWLGSLLLAQHAARKTAYFRAITRVSGE